MNLVIVEDIQWDCSYTRKNESMFFPQLMNIKSSDLVLEIGPGAYPFWRSDCLADKFDDTSEVDLKQFGGAQLQTKGKPLFKIMDNKLPFKDKAFDYVICSHVFEHVPVSDLPLLVSEIMRVSPRAYIEFPRPLYDYIYHINVHLNLLDIVNGEIICLDKRHTKLTALKRFQDYSMMLREKDLFSIDAYYAPVVAVGMEFRDTIKLRVLDSEEEFWSLVYGNNYFVSPPGLFWKIKNKVHFKRMYKAIFGEMKKSNFTNLLI